MSLSQIQTRKWLYVDCNCVDVSYVTSGIEKRTCVTNGYFGPPEPINLPPEYKICYKDVKCFNGTCGLRGITGSPGSGYNTIFNKYVSKEWLPVVYNITLLNKTYTINVKDSNEKILDTLPKEFSITKLYCPENTKHHDTEQYLEAIDTNSVKINYEFDDVNNLLLTLNYCDGCKENVITYYENLISGF